MSTPSTADQTGNAAVGREKGPRSAGEGEVAPNYVDEVSGRSGAVLDRISHALAVQDAMPALDGDWQPGDPLWPDPDGSIIAEGGQYIRPMFEVLDDADFNARCEPCAVSWVGPEPCWMCGGERVEPMPTYRFAPLTAYLSGDFLRVVDAQIDAALGFTIGGPDA